MKTGIKVMIIIAVIAVLVLAGILFILPPGNGKLPKKNNSENSLYEKTRLNVDETFLSLILLAEDTSKPVLMVCGGGPGIPQYLLEDMYPSVLSEEFILCYWDYRGTGLSFNKNLKAEDMTTERFIADALFVADYLSKRFNQEKIYIMGHSFGTYVALNTVNQHPEHFKAYIAMAQMCTQKESECLAFEYMKAQYEAIGNLKMAKKLARYDIRNSEEDFKSYSHSGLRDKAMHELGVGTARNLHSVITGIFLPSLRCRAYTQKERINIWRGKIFSNDFAIRHDTLNFNAFDAVKTLDIPVYFVAGKYDYTCCFDLQKKYFEHISAPKKELFVFENSAHSPLYEEPEKAREVLRHIQGRLK